MGPSPYECRALDEIHAWKHRKQTRWRQTLRLVNLPLEMAGNLVIKAPAFERAMENSIGGLVSILNDFAQWSVSHAAIHEEYRGDGHIHVKEHKDVFSIDLEQIDRTIGVLAAKYKAAALAQGAATGFAGIVGIPVDVFAVVLLNLRAIGEYATYCGFDVRAQQERIFAMNVLGLASSPTDSAKNKVMARLGKIAQDVASKKTWKELEKSAFVRIIQQIAKSLGIRLTKAKLAQIIPFTGAAVGGGFNIYFTSKVCDAAYMLYRERFLAERYGGQVIDASHQAD